MENTTLHACEFETLLMLYLHPEKVSMKKAVDEKIKRKEFEFFLPKTKSGVWGTLTKATKRGAS